MWSRFDVRSRSRLDPVDGHPSRRVRPATNRATILVLRSGGKDSSASASSNAAAINAAVRSVMRASRSTTPAFIATPGDLRCQLCRGDVGHDLGAIHNRGLVKRRDTATKLLRRTGRQSDAEQHGRQRLHVNFHAERASSPDRRESRACARPAGVLPVGSRHRPNPGVIGTHRPSRPSSATTPSARPGTASRPRGAGSGRRTAGIPPYAPRWNGKLERFFGTLGCEWAHGRAWPDSATRDRALLSRIRYFNQRRRHSAARG